MNGWYSVLRFNHQPNVVVLLFCSLLVWGIAQRDGHVSWLLGMVFLLGAAWHC
jgi:Ca2+/H+ antiporter